MSCESVAVVEKAPGAVDRGVAIRGPADQVIDVVGIVETQIEELPSTVGRLGMIRGCSAYAVVAVVGIFGTGSTK